MTIHKEGYNIIRLSLSFAISFFLLTFYFLAEYTIIQILIYIAIISILLWVVSFFRYPKRIVKVNANNIISSADGEVVAIEEVMENEYFHEKRIQVSVFMSPFNVHANWYPVSGTVKYMKYHPGKHLVAYNPKSSFENEMTTLVIESTVNRPQSTEKREILIRQIAGIMARRIVYYSKEGQQTQQGEQLGFIKFGSRVDLLLPLNAKIKVKLNQKVKGTQTVIAEF